MLMSSGSQTLYTKYHLRKYLAHCYLSSSAVGPEYELLDNDEGFLFAIRIFISSNKTGG